MIQMSNLMGYISRTKEESPEVEAKEYIGIVVGYGRPPTHLSFSFQLKDTVEVSVGDFVEVPAGSSVIVGRITRIVSRNRSLMDPEFIRIHLERNLPIDARIAVSRDNWREAFVEIISIMKSGEFLPPNIPPSPGDYVYPADSETIRRILNIKEEGLFVGYMHGHRDLRIVLDPEVLLRLHFAVFGSTGSGKSYTVGVIVEEFLKSGYPVVIIDAHGEYSSLSKPNDSEKEVEELGIFGLEPMGFPVNVFIPSKLTVGFEDLDVDALSEVTKMSPIMSDLLYLAFKHIDSVGYTLDESSEMRNKAWVDRLIRAVNVAASKWKFDNKTKIALRRRIETLKELSIFGESLDIKSIINKGHATIIDISRGLTDYERRVYVGIILKRLFEARKKKIIPPLLTVIEESHIFAPQDIDTYSKTMMRRIAREGRKFGIGIGIISQRIIGLDKDVISQCGTKFILRIDSKTDLDYLKPYTSLLTSEDIKRIPHLPTGMAYITGQVLRYPILTKIRPRQSKHYTFE